MKKLCKTCLYWHKYKSSDCIPGGEVYGRCDCGKFIYVDDFSPPYPVDILLYWDYEDYGANFATGPEFSCVHWTRKDWEVEV